MMVIGFIAPERHHLGCLSDDSLRSSLALQNTPMPVITWSIVAKQRRMKVSDRQHSHGLPQLLASRNQSDGHRYFLIRSWKRVRSNTDRRKARCQDSFPVATVAAGWVTRRSDSRLLTNLSLLPFTYAARQEIACRHTPYSCWAQLAFGGGGGGIIEHCVFG